MEASIRPWFTTGIALVGASAIAMAPIAPITQSSPATNVRAATTAVSSEFELTALEFPYILTLPIVRQQIRNWAENWAVYLAGLGQAGVGLGQSVLAIPGVTVEIIQEVLALDFVGAFDTLTTAIRDAVVAVGQPLLDSLIWRNQKYLAVQTALQAAVPQAIIDSLNGFLTAGNLVVNSLIVGTQDLVAAILTLNLGNIIDAAVDGTTNFVVALADGAGAIVDGIEAAQLGIATALATEPPAMSVADVSGLRTLPTARTLSLPSASSAVALDVVAPQQDQPASPSTQDEPTEVVDVVATDAEDAPETPADSDVSPTSDDPDEDAEAADPPKKSVNHSPVKRSKKQPVEKVTAEVGQDTQESDEAEPAAKPEADAAA